MPSPRHFRIQQWGAVLVADLHNRNAQTTLSPQGRNMKKMILIIWKAWNEAKLAYANRYAHHRLGS
jgi:hypothetical protein